MTPRVLQIGLIAALAVGLTASTARAQFEEPRGAGRFEVTGFPGGGMFFTGGEVSSSFGTYSLGGALVFNVNPWIGIEGEIAGGLGQTRQDVTVNGVDFLNTRVPRLLSYTGNVVVNPIRSDRRLVPYITGGIGGLTMFTRSEVVQLGVTETNTFFTGNIGAGLRWYATEMLGLRFDYRLIGVATRDEPGAEFLARDDARLGHRVYGGIVLTGGR